MRIPIPTKGMSLYNQNGERLYLNPSERERFISVATMRLPPLQSSLCLTLAHTGCRISEARNLKKWDIQAEEQLISIYTLKRRSTHVMREVPVPRSFIQILESVHCNALSPPGAYLWSTTSRPPPRSTVYRWVKEAMQLAHIHGPQACPKGLRHGFGVHATRSGVQLHMTQKWMGHASIETTAIYATALGPEELEIAERMW